MSRKIVGPSVIPDRLKFMQGQSAWSYVDVINRALQVNPVDDQCSIQVVIKYTIDQSVLNQIVSFYLSAGWTEVLTEVVGSGDTLIGSTSFEFRS